MDGQADPEGGEFCAFVREEPPPYRLYEVVLDAADHGALGRWWAELLGGRCIDEGKGFVSIADIPGAPFEYLDVGTVPEPKAVKNRVHLDIQPPTGTRDAFVERMLTLGATVHEDHRRPDGTGWVTLRDPEGNEFCVERSAPERGL